MSLRDLFLTKAIAGGAGAGSGGVQPNWNQNDETAADYVKNRTHYVGMTDKIATHTSTFTVEDEGMSCGAVEYSVFELTVGKQYKVVFDGTEYICTAQELYRGVGLGNLVLSHKDYTKNQTVSLPCCPMDIAELNNTGEPFAVVVNWYYSDATGWYTSADGEHTFTICSLDEQFEVVHQIDQKFIPGDAFVFTVNFNLTQQDDGTRVLSADKTIEQIYAAFSANKLVQAKYGIYIIPLESCSSTGADFYRVLDDYGISLSVSESGASGGKKCLSDIG